MKLSGSSREFCVSPVPLSVSATSVTSALPGGDASTYGSSPVSMSSAPGSASVSEPSSVWASPGPGGGTSSAKAAFGIAVKISIASSRASSTVIIL